MSSSNRLRHVTGDRHCLQRRVSAGKAFWTSYDCILPHHMRELWTSRASSSEERPYLLLASKNFASSCTLSGLGCVDA